MKKQKWYELRVTRTDGAIDELELKGELTRERVENATSKEQIKFFKQFGNRAYLSNGTKKKIDGNNINNVEYK